MFLLLGLRSTQETGGMEERRAAELGDFASYLDWSNGFASTVLLLSPSWWSCHSYVRQEMQTKNIYLSLLPNENPNIHLVKV